MLKFNSSILTVTDKYLLEEQDKKKNSKSNNNDVKVTLKTHLQLTQYCPFVSFFVHLVLLVLD